MLNIFISTSYKLESFWKKGPQLIKCPHQTGLWANLWFVFLIDGLCVRAQLTMCNTAPGLVVLDARKRHAEETSKQHSFMTSGSAPASKFQSWFPSVMDCAMEL